jgi:hypothetical protein
MRFRPANIRLINRRSNLPRLLLALFSKNGKGYSNEKNHECAAVDRVTPYQSNSPDGVPNGFMAFRTGVRAWTPARQPDWSPALQKAATI